MDNRVAKRDRSGIQDVSYGRKRRRIGDRRRKPSEYSDREGNVSCSDRQEDRLKIYI
jgi:hypothetical protein